MKADRDLNFKGGRNYLHSTTLFNDIAQFRGEGISTIDFSFNRKTNRQVSYQSKPPSGDQVPVATWRDDRGTIFVVERAEVISTSVPFDEDGLAEGFDFDLTSREATIPADIGTHSPIEAVVAAFKALLLRSVVADKTRLAFVRIRLAKPLSLPLRVAYGRRIGEFHQGEIHSDDQRIGQIFFGEWR